MTRASITLNEGQEHALAEILAAVAAGDRHLLTGYAGSGKTTLMQEFARRLAGQGKSVVMSAPTHKAVSVLARKLAEAEIGGVDCRTIHSLLSLRPKAHSDRQVFLRDKRAKPVMADVVVIDECSMIGADLMAHIKRHLPVSFVLFVGDPAQLPPVGEESSPTFAIARRSHLETIVRQSAGSPVLTAAHAIREGQGKPIDWAWCRSERIKSKGVFLPRQNAERWMQKAFTSEEFNDDPDAFRYLAWTNARVAEVNRKVQRWRYGPMDAPFMIGERCLARSPVILDKQIVVNTNEECGVLEIEKSSYRYQVPTADGAQGWTAIIPSWRILLQKEDGAQYPTHMVAEDRAYQAVIGKITDEAAECRDRWQDLHDFKGGLVQLQCIYAMTTHTSQGSTFKNVFLDIPDIRRRARDNPLETQQMLYVAATRPTHALMLVGI